MLKKKLTRFILYAMEYLVSLFDTSKHTSAVQSTNFLLVRLDAWGDYIMFRNFIELLKKSNEYKLHNFYLLGNSAWQQFAETLDAPFIDNFIWVDIKKFKFSCIYRKQLINQLNEIGFDTIFYPNYSRQYTVDAFIKQVQSTNKIAVDGDARNTCTYLYKKSNKFYTRLLAIDKTIEFEFLRNCAIVQQLADLQVPVKPYLPVLTKYEGLKVDYAVLFIDAADDYRRWPAKRFGKVARHISKKYDLHCVLAGRNSEFAEAIINTTSGIMLINLTGNTTLTELTTIIQHAKILISNDTGAVHIGVAASVKTICVSNGNHYGRFVPYPEQVYKDVKTLFPEALYKKGNDFQTLVNSYREGSMLDISELKSDGVIEEIDKLMK